MGKNILIADAGAKDHRERNIKKAHQVYGKGTFHRCGGRGK